MVRRHLSISARANHRSRPMFRVSATAERFLANLRYSLASPRGEYVVTLQGKASNSTVKDQGLPLGLTPEHDSLTPKLPDFERAFVVRGEKIRTYHFPQSRMSDRISKREPLELLALRVGDVLDTLDGLREAETGEGGLYARTASTSPSGPWRTGSTQGRPRSSSTSRHAAAASSSEAI